MPERFPFSIGLNALQTESSTFSPVNSSASTMFGAFGNTSSPGGSGFMSSVVGISEPTLERWRIYNRQYLKTGLYSVNGIPILPGSNARWKVYLCN